MEVSHPDEDLDPVDTSANHAFCRGREVPDEFFDHRHGHGAGNGVVALIRYRRWGYGHLATAISQAERRTALVEQLAEEPHVVGLAQRGHLCERGNARIGRRATRRVHDSFERLDVVRLGEDQTDVVADSGLVVGDLAGSEESAFGHPCAVRPEEESVLERNTADLCRREELREVHQRRITSTT